jgi:hypothetical protein
VVGANQYHCTCSNRPHHSRARLRYIQHLCNICQCTHGDDRTRASLTPTCAAAPHKTIPIHSTHLSAPRGSPFHIEYLDNPDSRRMLTQTLRTYAATLPPANTRQPNHRSLIHHPKSSFHISPENTEPPRLQAPTRDGITSIHCGWSIVFYDLFDSKVSTFKVSIFSLGLLTKLNRFSDLNKQLNT